MTDPTMTISLAKSSLSERTRGRERSKTESKTRKTNRIFWLFRGRRWLRNGQTNWRTRV